MKLDRFSKVGIQRELYIDWFDQAARLHGMEFSKSDARQEIYSYLDSARGFSTPPSKQTKTYVANALIKSWIAPDRDLIPMRNAVFLLLQEHPNARVPIHWSLLGAAYPFWYSVAAVIGRLLNLQNQVTQEQVVTRLKEMFGDRQTVSRRARYVIRSFVSWGVLNDMRTQGCYERTTPIFVSDVNLAVLMFESVLLTIPEAKCALGFLQSYPAFFPFQFPAMTGDFISQRNERIDVVRYGLDDELLRLSG